MPRHASRGIVERLCTPAGEICIKKIDSTLRGNVAAETLAAMHALGRANAIIVPAFPAQGRTVVGGMVHVNGVPLPQTGFARDALSPPPLAPLDQVFRAAAPRRRWSWSRPDGPFELVRPGEGLRVFVVDSATDADLVRTVAGLERSAGSLPPGGFGGHRRCRRAGLPAAARAHRERPRAAARSSSPSGPAPSRAPGRWPRSLRSRAWSCFPHPTARPRATRCCARRPRR